MELSLIKGARSLAHFNACTIQNPVTSLLPSVATLQDSISCNICEPHSVSHKVSNGSRICPVHSKAFEI